MRTSAAIPLMALAAIFATPTFAQQWSFDGYNATKANFIGNVSSSLPQISPAQPTDQIGLVRYYDNLAFGYSLPLSAFASRNDINNLSESVNGLNNGINERINGLNQRLDSLDERINGLSQRIYELNFFARRDAARAMEASVLASAITILPPNAGDRFSLTFSGAATEGYGAASISGTYRVTEDALVFGGYARSQNQNLVKGGVSLSFR